MSQRVFLYDANPAGRVARAAILQEAGYDVVAAANASDSETILRECEDVGVVVISYSRGAEGVIGFCQRLRQPRPVIVVASKLDLISGEVDRLGATMVVKKCANEVRNLIRAVEQASRAQPGRRRLAAARRTLAASAGA